MDYNEYQIKADNKAKEVIEEFSNLVNNFSFESKDFIKHFSRQHRTLQQSMFNAMLGVMVAMSKDDYQTDGRNEYAKRTAQDMIKGYAEIKKQEYLAEYGNEEFYQKRAEEIKQGIIEKPEMYLNLPCI